MKFTGILTVLTALILTMGNAMAVAPGKSVELGGPKNKVIFEGKIHADKGLKCADCHTTPKLFAMKKGGDKITMAAMNEGKFCGACHDGKKAFSVKVQADCVKCHKAGGAEAKAEQKLPIRAQGASQAGMHRYLIERTFPAGALEGVDAATKVKVNAANASVGVRWVESFVNADKTKTYCVYEGPSEEAIRKAAELNMMPVDKITEVPVTLTPE